MKIMNANLEARVNMMVEYGPREHVLGIACITLACLYNF